MEGSDRRKVQAMKLRAMEKPEVKEETRNNARTFHHVQLLCATFNHLEDVAVEDLVFLCKFFRVTEVFANIFGFDLLRSNLARRNGEGERDEGRGERQRGRGRVGEGEEARGTGGR